MTRSATRINTENEESPLARIKADASLNASRCRMVRRVSTRVNIATLQVDSAGKARFIRFREENEGETSVGITEGSGTANGPCRRQFVSSFRRRRCIAKLRFQTAIGRTTVKVFVRNFVEDCCDLKLC